MATAASRGTRSRVNRAFQKKSLAPRMPLLSLTALGVSLICMGWVSLWLRMRSRTTPRAGSAKDAFFNLVRPSEANAARAVDFFARARGLNGDAGIRRAVRSALADRFAPPLSDALADAAWHLAALDALQRGDSAPRPADTAFVVYHATTWFGKDLHNFLTARLISCPPQKKEWPPCAIAAYPAWLRKLWSAADLVLYHRAEGLEERTTPPPSALLHGGGSGGEGNANANASTPPRQRHALLAAENFASLFRSPTTALFDTELSYRQRSLFREGGYEDTFLAAANINWSLQKGGEGKGQGGGETETTWATLAATPPLPAASRFDLGQPPSPSGSLDFDNSPRNATITFASSHCHSRSGREDLVTALETFVNIDTWGTGCLAAPWRRAGAAAGGGSAPDDLDAESAPYPRQEAVLARYKFTLALENANCGDYSTEKALLALARGSIPIIWGHSNAFDFLPARDAVINVRDFTSVRALAAHLRFVAGSDTSFNTFHAWRDRPMATYGPALRAALQRILPVAEWAEGAGGAATTWACGLCYALQDAEKMTKSVLKVSETASLPPPLAPPETFGPPPPFSPPQPGPVPPFSCSPPITILDDANGTFVYPPLNARLESWGSGRRVPGPFLSRALAARARERIALGLPPAKVNLDFLAEKTAVA